MKNWITQLEPIINEYGEGGKLTLEDVNELVHIIRAKINLQQGNITEDQYERNLNGSAARDEILERAAHYLCTDNEDGITVGSSLKLIEEQADIDGSVMVDSVDGIILWDAVMDRYTVDEFLDEIN